MFDGEIGEFIDEQMDICQEDYPEYWVFQSVFANNSEYKSRYLANK